MNTHYDKRHNEARQNSSGDGKERQQQYQQQLQLRQPDKMCTLKRRMKKKTEKLNVYAALKSRGEPSAAVTVSYFNIAHITNSLFSLLIIVFITPCVHVLFQLAAV